MPFAIAITGSLSRLNFVWNREYREGSEFCISLSVLGKKKKILLESLKEIQHLNHYNLQNTSFKKFQHLTRNQTEY